MHEYGEGLDRCSAQRALRKALSIGDVLMKVQGAKDRGITNILALRGGEKNPNLSFFVYSCLRLLRSAQRRRRLDPDRLPLPARRGPRLLHPRTA